MTFLEQIEQKLQEIDPNVYYGMAIRQKQETIWNYIVFNRTSLKTNPHKTSITDHFDVHIVRENYVPEGIEKEVINSLTELAGVGLANADLTFSYAQKPNTDTVIEILTISFIRACKNV